MLKLATILDNPGEPLADTRYRDPEQLKALGYNGMVLYETTGLSGVDSPDAVPAGEIRRWVAQQFDLLTQRIARVRAAGLDAYIFYDVLSLARNVVEREVAALTCKKKPNVLCPASEPAIQRSGQALQVLLEQLPECSGVVLRLGDNDAARLPYLVGNDIYSPHCARCSELGRADRITAVIDVFYKLVVEQLGRRLIVRAWNVRPNGMHDSVDLCRRVVSRLPGAGDPTDDRLVLSFKFTHTDFWRYQKWNPPSLACGRRPIIYELQCQREFEGKGGIPNWQVPLWRDGYPEPAAGSAAAANGNGASHANGLAEVSKKINLAGLWAWVRGGGWGGPFVKNETWIDANVFAVPHLADRPDADPAGLAERWVAERLNVTDPAVASSIIQTLQRSPTAILKGFYIGPFARAKADPWHPSADWISDDLVDAQAAWRIIQRLPEPALDEAVLEKQDAVELISHSRTGLQHLVTDRNKGVLDPLVHTLLYSESFFESLRDLVAGLVAYRRWQKFHDRAGGELCRQRLLAAQAHWNQHTQRHGSLPGAATAFRDAHFWELTQHILNEVTAVPVGSGK